ncbi:hypothetical protein ASF62_09055 [Leifsonia sp. Leaf325]|nr:hypothetical protein [Leifsonia sp. Leaf325]KQQ94271.1 hypothetical protein ASF62_09055 [Leifsonia sp. Leaf325]
MGALYYDGEEFDFDDRTLAHLQLVVSTKLRRREDFFLTWSVPMERGSGRHSIWIDNGVPIRFYFSGSRTPSINREWIESLMLSASRASGLILGDEPTESRPAPPAG